MPRVSVIIAVLNGVNTIAKSIESAQRQTVKDIEIVVVDDGSTDGTSDLVRRYVTVDPRITLIRLEKNVGSPAATNIAIGKASGEWVAILDADDWYEPNRLEILLQAADHHKADVSCDNLKIFDHAQNEVVEQTRYGAKWRSADLRRRNIFQARQPDAASFHRLHQTDG